uniref:Transmembrane protein n=1 Tax=Panagrellus redivivus TaxID=6233 RepID=A0A7E4VY24_PANRE
MNSIHHLLEWNRHRKLDFAVQKLALSLTFLMLWLAGSLDFRRKRSSTSSMAQVHLSTYKMAGEAGSNMDSRARSTKLTLFWSFLELAYTKEPKSSTEERKTNSM